MEISTVAIIIYGRGFNWFRHIWFHRGQVQTLNFINVFYEKLFQHFFRYGRRVAFLTAGLSQVVVLNVVPLAVNFYAYCILQIITGALQQGCYIIGFIIGQVF